MAKWMINDHEVGGTVNTAEAITCLDKDGKLSNVQKELDEMAQLDQKVTECFQSVSDGKALVASAITDKGVTTAPDATFAMMAGNIENIRVNNEEFALFESIVWTQWYNGGTHFPYAAGSAGAFEFNTHDGICSASITSNYIDITKYNSLDLYVISTSETNQWYGNTLSVQDSSGNTVKSVTIPGSTSNKLFSIDLSALTGNHRIVWNICTVDCRFKYLKLITTYPELEYYIYGGKVYVNPVITGDGIPHVAIVDDVLLSKYMGYDGQAIASFNQPLHAKAGDVLRIRYKSLTDNNPNSRILLYVSSTNSHSGDLLNTQIWSLERTYYEFVVPKDTDVYVRFIFKYTSAYVSEIFLEHK